MGTEKNALDKSRLSASEVAALEERERQGYEKYPEDLDEVLMWERVTAWPAEWQIKANTSSAPDSPHRAKS